jgi:hypothetical protein
MDFGPIQLLAFTFDDVNKLQGQLKAELDELRGHGLIHILDLLFIKKELDGTVHSLEASDMPAYAGSDLGALLGRMLGLDAAAPQASLGELLGAMLIPGEGAGLSLDQIRHLADGVPPGKAIALLMVEHAWALGFSTALRETEGTLIAQGFLTRDALLAIGQELHAIVEAEITIERAAAIKGAAMLDALTTVAAAEELEQAAINQAAATAVGVDAFRGAIAAEAVRALVVAGLLEEAAAPEAIAILVDAELINVDAFQQATDAADAAAAELTTSGW